MILVRSLAARASVLAAMPGLSEGDIKRHLWYFTHCLKLLPQQYDGLDTNRVTVAYFCTVALDILRSLDAAYTIVPKKDFIKWIYNLQLRPGSDEHAGCGGFQGGTFLGNKFCDEGVHVCSGEHDTSHIAMTYTALALLITLGDDLSGVDRDSVVGGLKALQLEDGSFACVRKGSESDMRFMYCACVISYMINDWRGVDRAKAKEWILSCQRYEGGFGLLKGQEAHGGSTYCALASMSLMGCLDEVPHRDDLVRWCTARQIGGFQGRTNKLEDTCYSFWVGGSLKMLGVDHLIKPAPLATFIESCKFKAGGYSKTPGQYPDVLHAMYSLCGLSLIGEAAVVEIDPKLGLTARAAAWCEELRARHAAGAGAEADSTAAGDASGGAGAGAGAGSGATTGAAGAAPTAAEGVVAAAGSASGDAVAASDTSEGATTAADAAEAPPASAADVHVEVEPDNTS